MTIRNQLHKKGSDTALVIASGWQAFLATFAADLEAGVYSPEFRHGSPSTRYVLDEIGLGVFRLSELHNPKVYLDQGTPWRLLVPPLTYPNPAGAFYGYEEAPPGGTQRLIHCTASIAMLLLALEAGVYAAQEKGKGVIGQESQCIQLCKEYLPNDRRAQLAAVIYETCQGAWEDELPTSTPDRKLLRGLCQDMLVLENDYLNLCHDYLLAQLRHGGISRIEEKRQVGQTLLQVVYQDTEIAATLRAWTSDPGVRAGATKALEAVERFGGELSS